MITVMDFNVSHIEHAMRIASQEYNRERGFVPALPPCDAVPDLTPFARNGMGVAAFEDGEMVGFLCGTNPFPNAFRSTDAIGVFSPMGANGAIGGSRAAVYARMYQAAGAKWAAAGASSHAVSLYAHDEDAQRQFFRYGFGQRTADALRGIDDMDAPPCPGYEFEVLAPERALEVLPLENELTKSYADSPFFMRREMACEAAFLEDCERCRTVYCAASYAGRFAAFMCAGLDGETFVQHEPGYLHIKGAYCLPEHRGCGVSQRLLSLLMHALKSQGYTRLGVDFESFNPSGAGFWLKHFEAYTVGVVRRIDEHVLITR